MKYSKYIQIVLLSIVFCLGLFSTAWSRIYLDITSANLEKIPIAVPGFVSKQLPGRTGGKGKGLAEILSKSLAFHGFLKIVPAVSYGGRQNADWNAHGVDFAVLGQYETSPEGIVMELRLIDAGEGRMVLGRRYRGEWSKHRQMLYKFCDDVILELTGERGVGLSNIAFVSDKTSHKEIYISDVLGEEIKQITNFGKIAVSPKFSPDGSKLVYTSYHQGNPNLYITDLYKGNLPRPLSKRNGLNMAPAWSPDGRSMAITLSKSGEPDLYLMDANGKILRQLTKNVGINVSPSWSPDGRKLAFVSDRSGEPQIYVMDMAKKTTRRLTYLGKYNTNPSWSPKGDLIAYSGSYEGNYHIFTIAPKGGLPARLTRYWGDHESPSWSPDGRQIAFMRRRNNLQQICAVFKNGTGLRELFRMKGNQTFPQWSPRLKK